MIVSEQDRPVEPGGPYGKRRAAIALRAAGPGRPPKTICYTETEHAVWAVVADALTDAWHEHGAAAARTALEVLALDARRVPQLSEVTAKLEPVSGFRFEAVPGLVEPETFFGHLADGVFLSTQYVRWEGSPLYTPEPDVIHEVFGHAHMLTDPVLAGLHRRAGAAYRRVSDPEARQFVADVFWFSAEFGIVREDGEWKAYGAGLLSSIGELAQFSVAASVVPLDIALMGTLPYDIDHYQPTLFGAESLDEVADVVGGFFDTCTDDSIAELRQTASETTRSRG